ncbi:MAG: M20/M25/M40 family metallo-hydrolase, partial [Planctomycetes bacterium]|nr:M20/M25/M40 family metallo-hydrolase [Planctomycetota bacterium]
MKEASVKISQEQIIDALCQLVRIKRVSGNEHEAVELFKKLFTQHGVSFKQSGRNLLAWRGSGKKTLLFNTHTDTVPANKGWTLDPHDSLRKDGRVHGLGAN